MSKAAMGQKPLVKWMQLFLNEPLATGRGWLNPTIAPRPSLQEGSRNCRLTIVDFRLNRGLSIDNPKSKIGNSKVVS